MRRRAIREEVVVELGGVIVARYHACAEEAEVILIVRARENFYAVLARGRQAHRAFHRPVGTPLKVTGTIIRQPLPDSCGYRVVSFIDCRRMVFGDQLVHLSPALPEEFADQLPKYQIFQRCDSLSFTHG